MRAEADEPNRSVVRLLPRIELRAQETKTLPQRSCSPRATPARNLDHRCGDLHHAGIEIERAACWQVIRAPRAMHERSSHHVARRTEDVFRLLRLPIHYGRELCLEPDRGHAFPGAWYTLPDPARPLVCTRLLCALHRHQLTSPCYCVLN